MCEAYAEAKTTTKSSA